MGEKTGEKKTTRRAFLKISGAAALAAGVGGFLPNFRSKSQGKKNIFSGISYAGEMPVYKIYALKYGASDLFPQYVFHWMGKPAFKPNQPPPYVGFYYWLIQGSGINILYDTGTTASTAKAHKLLDYKSHSTMLDKMGMKTSDINAVITSHAHWDHVNGIGQFPKATHYIQEMCYRWTVEKAPQYAMLRKIHWPSEEDINLLVKYNAQGNLVLIPGERNGAAIEIFPGISAIRVDGHYMGCQAIKVNSAKGPVVLASDSVYLYSNYEEDWPVGICLESLTDSLDAMNRFKKIIGKSGILVPGHDAEIMTRFTLIKPDVAQIA